MGEAQFSAMVLMAVLTITLSVLLPRKVSGDQMLNRSRWMMAGGTALMSIQFLLQYLLKLRMMGVTQAVMVNLLFFIPCSWLFTLSIFNLQHEGQIRRSIWWNGIVTWLVVVIVLIVAAFISGKSLLVDTPEMRIAEYISALAYCVMQVNYTFTLHRGSQQLTQALSNYYDYDTGDMLRWMKRSVLLLALVAIGAPFLIFSKGLLLFGYALIVFFTLYYLVFCFICYCVSNDSRRVSEAKANADETKMEEERSQVHTMTEEERRRIGLIVDDWIQKKGHLHSGITMQEAVREMQIPRYQLAAWLKTTEWELFNPWLTHLRIDEAKRQLKAHPDWSNDTIAQQCGFASRSYFQQVFKKQTDMTPAQYVRECKI